MSGNKKKEPFLTIQKYLEQKPEEAPKAGLLRDTVVRQGQVLGLQLIGFWDSWIKQYQ